MVSIKKRLAMFLLRSGLTLFLTLDLTIVHCLDSKKLFTTRPKSKEIFVGDSVTFDWDYSSEKDVTAVLFGIVRSKDDGTSDGAVEEMTLLRKSSKGPHFRTDKQEFKDILNRLKVEDKRASFTITKVRMNDTGKYFCKLKIKDQINDAVDYVDLKVVDLQINEEASRSEEESWEKLKISLVCMVRVVKDEPVSFTWFRQPNNQTLSRGMHIDTRTESVLTLITTSDHHFTTYTCAAKTRRTTKFHNVVVKRLYGPGPPLNLQQKYTFDRDKGESFLKVFWSPPKVNGGAKVTDYIVEYKPEGINWAKATRVMTKKTMYDRFNLKEGKNYYVRVLARNKVNEGGYSYEMKIELPGGYPSRRASSNSLNIHQSTLWSCLLNLTLLILKTYW